MGQAQQRFANARFTIEWGKAPRWIDAGSIRGHGSAETYDGIFFPYSHSWRQRHGRLPPCHGRTRARGCEGRGRCLVGGRLRHRGARMVGPGAGGRCRCAVQSGAGLQAGARGGCGQGAGRSALCRRRRAGPCPGIGQLRAYAVRGWAARGGHALYRGGCRPGRSARAISPRCGAFQRRSGGKGLAARLCAVDARQ